MRHKVREPLTTILELLGGAVIAYGIGLIYLPAGVIAGGAALLGVSYLVEQAGKGARRE